MAEQTIIDCPCKKTKCSRHGNCDACREHHKNVKHNLPVCERPSKEEKKAMRKSMRHSKT